MDFLFWKGRRVLITGHTGFKGSWLLLWLKQLGAIVSGYGLAPEGTHNLFNEIHLCDLPRSTFFHHIGDLADFPSLSSHVQSFQPEIVFHLAAQPLVRRSYEDPLGTWSTNVIGSLHLLEALKPLQHDCSVVMITTDKVYENREWTFGYREPDRLGGHDPYSASKAAAELAISCWRSSFCGSDKHQTPHLRIATARAGNVVGGGDWSENRIVPDAIRALSNSHQIHVRNPLSTRPWQHVLDPLFGYLRLAEELFCNPSAPCEPYNFGPTLNSNRTVGELIETILSHWSGSWVHTPEPSAPHEAHMLHLQIDKAFHHLGWYPRWDYSTTIKRTVDWYYNHYKGHSALECCLSDLDSYQSVLFSSNITSAS